MHNTSDLVIDRVLKKSSLDLNQVGQSTLTQYGLQVQVQVEDISIPTVKACNVSIRYSIVFKMLTENWLAFVEQGSKNFMISIINQDNVADFSFSRAENVEENFINAYWDLLLNV